MAVDVFVGPAADPAFEVSVAPGASSGVAASVVEDLVEGCRPGLNLLCEDEVGRTIRDDFVALVRSLAPAEALRAGTVGDVRSVTARHSVSRPTRPGRLGDGLAALTGAPLSTRGVPLPDVVPGPLIAASRSVRWSRLPAAAGGAGVVLAFGGPSEERALAPVGRALGARGVPFRIVEFSTRPLGYPSIMAVAPRAAVDSRALYRTLRRAWEDPGWWGAHWLPWVDRSLQAMASIVGRESAVAAAGGRHSLDGALVVVTAKVRWTRARALTAAASEVGVPTIACQHGVHIDGIEWEGHDVPVYAVAGESFAAVLRRRGFQGTMPIVGAPFFEDLEATHDAVVALRPIEASVIRSAADYVAHLHAAASALRDALGSDARIALRPHPREQLDATAERVLRTYGLEVDPSAAAPLWVAVESSVVAQAALSGGRVVMLSLNDHPWAYDFHTLPGVWTARTPDELATAVHQSRDAGPVDSAPWREAHGARLGGDAAEALADVILESIDR